ncbi:MAG: GTP-binding protein TypA/BipA [candidate division WS6 bacterium OLB20]|uniref:GTP-binding protein TypA/BipA n=1 Tax=candidate division WS6 bacterium OLB20 TaxID=1617426 RepID=A0A136LWK4_9BACT|nr:MAG: GTP-binding protein TypA/BipA [candidate division WS6 bacterium OLB20]
MNKENIRNIAIIAHVDHGKTTLVDAFLKQSNIFRDNQEEMNMEMILDTGELEREKGITIKAKNISIEYNGHRINVIDTPGHADFGGEVERTLNMAEGCLLIVDGAEGPMPQTRFVLKKALELNLKPIVVINKIDKPATDIARTLDKLQDLFLNLATTEDQLEFPVFYAIGRDGKVWQEMPADISAEADIRPLLDKILSYVPGPEGDENGPLQMQVTTLEFDAHTGRALVGKIRRGTVKAGDDIVVALPAENGHDIDAKGTVKQVLVKQGLQFVPSDSASVGEIVALVGVDSKAIGATVCARDNIEPLPVIKISDPSVRIKIEANTSPFLGREGEFVTVKQLQARLEREADTNISLQIEKNDDGSFYVAGRGDLQLAILLEELRREGFEFQVRRPEVILKTIDGVKHEPLEELYVEVPEEYSGAVLNEVSVRKGQLQNMDTENGQAKMEFTILTSRLLGLRHKLLTDTKGNLVMNNYLLEYVPQEKHEDFFRRGALISSDTGPASAYALNTIQERGELFIFPATDVYEGMIIGINKYEQDLEVNPTKERQKSGVRRNQAEITQVQLKGVKELTFEFALVFLGKDELLEVTPKSLRLRKRYLKKHERDWSQRKNLTDMAKQQLGLS